MFSAPPVITSFIVFLYIMNIASIPLIYDILIFYEYCENMLSNKYKILVI